MTELVHRTQDKRHQMMNDVRALCDAPHVPGLVDFVGAYHESENGQVLLFTSAGSSSLSLSAKCCQNWTHVCCSYRLLSYWNIWTVGRLEMCYRRQVLLAVFLTDTTSQSCNNLFRACYLHLIKLCMQATCSLLVHLFPSTEQNVLL